MALLTFAFFANSSARAHAACDELAAPLKDYLASSADLRTMPAELTDDQKIELTARLTTKGEALAKVGDRVFVSPGSEDYMSCLAALNSQLAKDNANAEAYFELAKNLQFRWERDFGKKLLQSRLRREMWANLGGGIGGYAIGALIMSRIHNPEVKFLGVLFKELFAMGAASTGSVGAQAQIRERQNLIDAGVPLPPLAVLKVGASEVDPEQKDIKELMTKEALKLAPLVVGSVTAQRILSGLRIAKTGSRSSAVVGLIAYVALDYLVEPLVENYLQDRKYKDLKTDLEKSLARMKSLANRKEELLLYQEVDHLTDIALALARRLYDPLMERSDAYNKELAELEKKFGGNSSVLKMRSRILTEKYLKDFSSLKDRRSIPVVTALIGRAESEIGALKRPYLETNRELLATLKFREELFTPPADAIEDLGEDGGIETKALAPANVFLKKEQTQ